MAELTIAQAATGEQRIKMTYAEYLAQPDLGVLTEWANGEAIIFMSPLPLHQRVVGFLYELLALYVRLMNVGEVLAAPLEMRVLPGSNAREPDIVFVAREHAKRVDDKRLDGPADLAVEVISEESVSRDRTDKFYEYQDGGVREYWLIDPRPGKERVDSYWLTPQGRYQAIVPDADDRYSSTVVPGFWFKAAWFSQKPLPNPLLTLADIAPDALRAALAAKLGL